MYAIIHKQMDSFNKFLPKWMMLKEKFQDVTVFQDVEWIKSCWDYLRQEIDVSPYIVEIKKGDETIGLMPLYTKTEEYIGCNFNILKPIGTKFSDYLVPLLSKEHSLKDQIEVAFNKIYEDKNHWDCIDWGDIPERSTFAKELINLYKNKSSLLVRNMETACPFIKLNNNVEEVKNQCSKKFLKGIYYYERKLNREGILEYNRVKSYEEIEPIMTKLFDLHCERWGQTSTPSDFEKMAFREQTLKMAKILYKNNALHLSYLTHNNKIAAIEYGMMDDKRRYLYIGAMNAEFSKYPVGHILVYYIILEACNKSFEIVDFLRGDEPYKRKWGAVDHFNVDYMIFNRSIKSSLFKRIHQTYFCEASQKKLFVSQLPIKLFIRTSSFLFNVIDKAKHKYRTISSPS